jgi:hypothetical protein
MVQFLKAVPAQTALWLAFVVGGDEYRTPVTFVHISIAKLLSKFFIFAFSLLEFFQDLVQ